MRTAISPRFATMSRRTAMGALYAAGAGVSGLRPWVDEGWILATVPPVNVAVLVVAASRRGRRSRRPDVLRDPGRRLPRVRPRNGRRARREPPTTRHRRSSASRCRWDAVEGTQGTNDWALPDSVLDALQDAGIDAVVTLYGTPRWANGGKGPNVAPLRGSDFARFAGAAAERYPFVHRWTIWNEPNQRRWLSTASPTQYVTRLLNPAYAAIHGASPESRVAGGVTAPRGSAGGTSPVAFIRGMGRSGARLDAYAHHPYALTPRRRRGAAAARKTARRSRWRRSAAS